ncbi:hypothetical protein D3C71_1456950 [compost metagenome]
MFHCDSGSTPICAPNPTEAIGGVLEKISASGPMPTSRYCDHWPRSTNSAFSLAAWSDPGRKRDRSEPIKACIRTRISSARLASPPASSSIIRSSRLMAKVTPAALMGCRSQGAKRRTPPWFCKVASIKARTSPNDSPLALFASATRSGRSSRSETVGATAVMSMTSPLRTTTTLGPSMGAGRHTRPTSSAPARSAGSEFSWFMSLHALCLVGGIRIRSHESRRRPL